MRSCHVLHDNVKDNLILPFQFGCQLSLFFFLITLYDISCTILDISVQTGHIFLFYNCTWKNFSVFNVEYNIVMDFYICHFIHLLLEILLVCWMQFVMISVGYFLVFAISLVATSVLPLVSVRSMDLNCFTSVSWSTGF